VHIAEDLYTIGPGAGAGKLPRILQVAADLAGKPLAQLRVLDLACLEGGFAIEFARHGAEAVGIEAREANIRKAQVVKDILGLEATAEQRAQALWSSLDNARSVWLTRPSLLNLFAHAGFTSAYECHNPSEPGKLQDRVTLVALKGRKQPILSVPSASNEPAK